ncbi:hypothetical protein B0H14DRAFT_3125227 [Mycena olivaceomarginata]|nr:hypothetical protein B0H14DRAFT_3125227 [Mycena olivaceomarginata]
MSASSPDEKEGGSPHLATLGKESDVEGSLAVDQDDGGTRIEVLCESESTSGRPHLMVEIQTSSSAKDGSCGCYMDEIYAESSFASHPLIGTISVVVGIMYAVAPPFIAKNADLLSRPMAVVFHCVGYIVVASSKTIDAVTGGHLHDRKLRNRVRYVNSNEEISASESAVQLTGPALAVNNLILVDISSLQWRGFIQGLSSTPSILTAFLAGNISSVISANTENRWHWGYGMFIIIVPACIAPIVVVLFWANFPLSLASSSYARRKLTAAEQDRSLVQTVLHYTGIIDAFGLLLLGVAFSLILLSFTLYMGAENGWKNSSLIAMLLVGGFLVIAFALWELKIASHPIMPRRVINKTLICCIIIDFMTFLSGNIFLTYFSSYVYVVKDWSLTNYTYFTNTVTVGLCVFGVCAGALQRITHRYKYIQRAGLCITIIWQGLVFLTVHGNKRPAEIFNFKGAPRADFLTCQRCRAGHQSNPLLPRWRLLKYRLHSSNPGERASPGQPAACPKLLPGWALTLCKDMALTIALLQLCTNLGGSIGSTVATAVWNANLAANLEKNLGATMAPPSTRLRSQTSTAPSWLHRTTIWVCTLFLASLILLFLALIAGCVTSNFYLGTTHNAVEDKVVSLRNSSETTRR